MVVRMAFWMSINLLKLLNPESFRREAMNIDTSFHAEMTDFPGIDMRFHRL